MDALGTVHTTFGVTSMVFGMGVVALKKGTRIHRTLGHLYFSSMVALNVTALSIYKLFGTFGPFHFFAIVALVYVFFGLKAAVLRRPREKWLARHAKFMSWSYVGLMAAAASEAVVRIPIGSFWPSIIVASVLVGAVGGLMIHTKLGAAIGGVLRREDARSSLAGADR
ncbi:MAG: DUF2306 domain-containing protein [Blastocatellia bacterium]|nr:DUF2306 domain-containing protein [Blastocatellia bacterium]